MFKFRLAKYMGEMAWNFSIVSLYFIILYYIYMIFQHILSYLCHGYNPLIFLFNIFLKNQLITNFIFKYTCIRISYYLSLLGVSSVNLLFRSSLYDIYVFFL